MMQRPSLQLSFLKSSSYLITIIVALLGVIIDYALTIHGLSIGYEETRPYFWLQTVGLFAVITVLYFIMNQVKRKAAMVVGLAFAIVMPALPIISNVMMLTLGWSPFIAK